MCDNGLASSVHVNDFGGLLLVELDSSQRLGSIVAVRLRLLGEVQICLRGRQVLT